MNMTKHKRDTCTANLRLALDHLTGSIEWRSREVAGVRADDAIEQAMLAPNLQKRYEALNMFYNAVRYGK